MIKFLSATMFAALLPVGAERVSQELLVRLSTSITSTTKAGARFDGVITGCAHSDCAALLPAGSTIHGVVKTVLAVGIGFRRERATVTLQFDTCNLPDGHPAPCAAELLSVDNARERVLSGNRIRGILAANHPQSYLSGLWMRPTSALLSRSVTGVTGAGRMLASPSPIMAGAVIASRLAFLRLPDPEIDVPAGSELIIRVTAEAPEHPVVSTPHLLPENLTAWLNAAPVNVIQHDGLQAADIINTAFRGTETEISSAFLGAGWTTADSISKRTFRKTYGAVAAMKAYPTAPVSPLRYQDRLPGLVFQKSFNSISKRHHIRLWREDSPDGAIWLGAATHDVGLAFDWKRALLTHKIDREIDRERDKVLADLVFAGCVANSSRIERTALVANGAKLATDGALHVIEPRFCEQSSRLSLPASTHKKAPFGKVILRRTILESRHYLLRGNGYYWAYRGLRSQKMFGRFARHNVMAAGLRPEVTKTSWRRGSGSNRRMRALQTLALPLGHRAPR